MHCHGSVLTHTQYDATGNRQAMTSTLNAVPGGTFSYDANDRLTSDNFNNNGNTISHAGITIGYDFENRMTAYGAIMLAYDGDGNRVSETVGGTTTKFLVDDKNPTGLSQVLDEIVSGSVTRTYAYGLQRTSENQLVSNTWTPSFYGYDGHGNVRFLTNSAGAITDSDDFDAFGMPIRTSGTTPNQFLYSGERFDSSIGVYDLRARYYNHATGRFLARDPIESGWRNGRSSCCRSCSTSQLNPYTYGSDDPVNRIDPTGKAAIADYLIAITFSVGAAITTYYALDFCTLWDGPNIYVGAGGSGGSDYQCEYFCIRSGLRCSYPTLPYCPVWTRGNVLTQCF
jgi:RHS repeat-associated protein